MAPGVNCGNCGFDKWVLDGTTFAVLICRRCDTSAQPGGMRVGPPKSPGTRDGWFTAPFGDRK